MAKWLKHLTVDQSRRFECLLFLSPSFPWKTSLWMKEPECKKNQHIYITFLPVNLRMGCHYRKVNILHTSIILPPSLPPSRTHSLFPSEIYRHIFRYTWLLVIWLCHLWQHGHRSSGRGAGLHLLVLPGELASYLLLGNY